MAAHPKHEQDVEALCRKLTRTLELAGDNERIALTSRSPWERDYCLRTAARRYREFVTMLAVYGALRAAEDPRRLPGRASESC